MYKSFTSNKLQDNAESSDTFAYKAVLTVASYTRTIYYKYNRIPVFYHLPLTLPSPLLYCEFHIFIEIGSICHCN